MKAIFDRKALLAAFGMVRGVASSRSPKPILQNLKLVVGREGSTLLATDMEVGIRYRVLGVEADQPGVVILPSSEFKRLSSILDRSVSIEVSEGLTVVQTRGSFVTFPSVDPLLYPDFPDFTSTSFHVVTAADLKRLIKQTVFAAEKKSNHFGRLAHKGVLFELSNFTVALVATDGRRLAHAVASAESVNNAEPTSGRPVVPVKALKLIERNLDEDDPLVRIAFPTANSVLIRTGQAVVHSRLIKDEFPQYRELLGDTPELFLVDREQFLAKVQEAEITVENTQDHGIDLDLLPSQGLLKFSGGTEIPVDYTGPPVSVSVSRPQVVSFLKTLHKGAGLAIGTKGERGSVYFRSGTTTYLVRPYTRGGAGARGGFWII